MNRFSSVLTQFVPRTLRPVLQLGLVTIGTIVIVASLAMAGLMLATMPPSESGFAEGLIFIVFGLYTLAGFVILAAGLLIPQRAGEGIHFTRTQRRILAYGVITPIGSVLAIPIGATLLPPLSSGMTSVLVIGLVALMLSGPVAIVFTLGMKFHQWIVER